MGYADVQISSLLRSETVAVGIPGGNKDTVIDAVVDLLAADDRVQSIDRLREAVHEREEQMSTGVGLGLALPHARTDAVSDTVAAFAVTSEPAEFQAPDGEPVRLVFLLAGPRADVSLHIRVLSRISRLMQRDRLRTRLLATTSAAEVIAAFEEAEMELLAG